MHQLGALKQRAVVLPPSSKPHHVQHGPSVAALRLKLQQPHRQWPQQQRRRHKAACSGSSSTSSSKDLQPDAAAALPAAAGPQHNQAAAGDQQQQPAWTAPGSSSSSSNGNAAPVSHTYEQVTPQIDCQPAYHHHHQQQQGEEHIQQQQQQGAEAAAPPAAASPAAAAAAAPWPPDVPWGLSTVAYVWALWLIAVVALGKLLLPAALAALDLERHRLAPHHEALINLVVDSGQLVSTLVVLRHCLGAYRPLARGFFRLSWRGGRWLTWVAAGVASFPLADWMSHQGVALLLGPEAAAAASDVLSTQLELSLYTHDWLTTGIYIVILFLLAPIWEELMFRGFLLTSLTRYMTPAAATAASATMFAMLHLRWEYFAPLVMVGVWCAALYARWNSLLPSMLLHGLWNLYLLVTMAMHVHVGCSQVTASLTVTVGMVAVLLAAAALPGLWQQLEQQSQSQQQQQPERCRWMWQWFGSRSSSSTSRIGGGGYMQQQQPSPGPGIAAEGAS